jgi:hypothetical protein
MALWRPLVAMSPVGSVFTQDVLAGAKEPPETLDRLAS